MSESAAPSSHSVTNDAVANASSAPPPSFSPPPQTMHSSDGNNMYEETPWVLEYNPPQWPLDRQIPGQRRSLVQAPPGNRPPPQYQPAPSQQHQPGSSQQYPRPQPGFGSTIPDNIKFPSGGVMAYESQKWILDTSGLQYWPSGSNIPGFVVGNGPGKPPQFIPIQTMSMTQQPPPQQHQGMHPQQSGMGYGNNNNNGPPMANISNASGGSNMHEETKWQLDREPPMWPSDRNIPGSKRDHTFQSAPGSGNVQQQIPPRRASAGQFYPQGANKRPSGGQFVPPNNMAAMPQMGRGRPCGQPRQNNAIPPQGGQLGQQQGQNGVSKDMNCQAQYYQGYVCPPYLQRNIRVKPTFTESALAMIDTFTSFDSTPCNQCDVPEEERPCEEQTEPVWVWMYTMLKDVINKVKELNNNGKCSETNKNNSTLSNSGGDSTQNPTSSNTSPSSTATNGNGNKGNSPLPPKPTGSEASNLPASNKESEASNLPPAKNDLEGNNLPPGKNDLDGNNVPPSKNDLGGSNLNENAPWRLEKELQMWPSDSNFPGSNRESGGAGGTGGIKLPNLSNVSGGSNMHEETKWQLEREPPMWPSDRNIPGSKRENTFKSAPAPVINANVVPAEKSKTNNAIAEKSETNNVAAANPVVEEVVPEVPKEVVPEVPKEVVSEVLKEVVPEVPEEVVADEAPEEVLAEVLELENVHVVEFVENNPETADDASIDQTKPEG